MDSSAMTRTVCYDAEVELMPRGRLESLREALLAQVVARARQSPFFRERLTGLGEVGNRLSLARFQEHVPLTSKQDLRAAGTRAWVEGSTPALLLATSGTTGSRIMLPYSTGDLHRWHALVARTLWTNGFRTGDVVLLPVPLGLFTGGQGMFGGLRHLGCQLIPLGATTTPVIADALRGIFGCSPTAVVGLPSHMLRLLETLPAAGVDPAQSPLCIGSFGAEAWTEAARARIELGFGLTAMDSYGIGEICGPGIAAECEAREGLHLWEDAFYAEIVDRASGEPVPDGTPGELVITPLFREVLPLLRYRTGDEAAIIPEVCDCGRAHRRLTRIARRLDDVLVITGVNVDPADIERILYSIPWVGNEFYLEASGDHHDTLCIHLEASERQPAPLDAETQIYEAVRRDFHVRVMVTLHAFGTLDRAPGKSRRIR
ncbi:MAG: Phenylacetate-coenzyme A ligase [bacterium ADurb.Bin429]|nr:MAG: Phenylacetate-coenzyme A ligase [bacterium ADurb.Bin429]